jgi:hypothetical protein
MKQLFFAACIACAFVACNTATTSTDSKKDTMAADITSSAENITYAYPVEYSSDFTIGDSKQVQTILQLWKDYDNNSLDDHIDALPILLQLI